MPSFLPQNLLFGTSSPFAAGNANTGHTERFPLPQQVQPSPQVDAPQTYGAQPFNQPAMRQYMEHLEQRPNYNEYQPRWWHQLGGALTGVGTGWQQGGAAGAQAGAFVRDAPFNRQYNQWASAAAPLQQSAQIESDDLKNRIDAFYKSLDAETKQTVAATGRINAQTGIQRLGLDRDKYQTSNLETFTDANGMLTEYDKITGQQAVIGKTLRGAEVARRLDIAEDQLEAYKQRTAAYYNSRQTGGDRTPAAALQFLEQPDGSLVLFNKQTSESQPIDSDLRQPRGANDQFTSQYMRLEQMVRRNPEYADFVDELPNGQIQPKSREDAIDAAGPFTGTDPAKEQLYDQFLRELYRDAGPQVNMPGYPTPPTTDVQPPDDSFELPPGWIVERQ